MKRNCFQTTFDQPLLPVRIIDGSVFWLLSYGAFRLLWMRASAPNVLAALSASVVFLLSMVVSGWQKQADRRKRREEIRLLLLQQKVLLLPREEVERRLGTKAIVQRAAISADDVLFWLRAGETELWLCGNMGEKDAEYLRGAAGTRCRIHARRETLERFSDLVSEDEITERTEEMRPRLSMKKLRQSVRRLPWNRYWVLGALLLALSFVARYPIYYRLLASVGFLIGGAIRTGRRLRHADG